MPLFHGCRGSISFNQINKQKQRQYRGSAIRTVRMYYKVKQKDKAAALAQGIAAIAVAVAVAVASAPAY